MKKHKIFYYLPYLIAIAILKPILTFVFFPNINNVISNPFYVNESGSAERTERKDWIFKEKTSDFNYHIENFLEYKNETFLYCLILVSFVFLVANYKSLTKK